MGILQCKTNRLPAIGDPDKIFPLDCPFGKAPGRNLVDNRSGIFAARIFRSENRQIGGARRNRSHLGPLYPIPLSRRPKNNQQSGSRRLGESCVIQHLCERGGSMREIDKNRKVGDFLNLFKPSYQNSRIKFGQNISNVL